MSIFQLYGGAVRTQLPAGSIDVSNLREVPDTQEVFILEDNDASKDKSIIFDLLEKVPGSYAEAVCIHIEDLIGFKEMNRHIENIQSTHLKTEVHMSFVKHHGMVTFLSLIRLDQVETDVLISMNIPLGQELEGDLILKTLQTDSDEKLHAPFIRLVNSYKLFKNAATSYKILDWGLFGQ